MPFALRRDGLHLAHGRVDDEGAPPALLHVRPQDRSRCAHGDLEALTGLAALVAVQQHRHLVARRILELFHHQAAASRGRAPVHVAKRLTLDVFPDAVQLVPGRTAQEQTAALLRLRAAFGEKPGELDEPRVDDECLRLALDEARARKRERVLDRQAHGVERVAAPRHAAQLEAAGETPPAGSVQLHPPLGEPSGPLVCHEARRRHGRCRLDHEIDPHVVSLQDVACGSVPVDMR